MIYVLFFLSGISGLIFETVWLRILSRILGNTVYATSVILASFMAGLALGSFLYGRFSVKIKNHLRCYAWLEIGIGLAAAVLLLSFDRLVPLFKAVYFLCHQERFLLTLFQSLILFILLLVPTTLMGGTLPILAVHTRRHRKELSERLGFLYGLNAFGATLGVFASGLYFIGQIGEAATVKIAIIINLFVGCFAFFMDRARSGKKESAEFFRQESPAPLMQSKGTYSSDVRRLIMGLYFLNGFAAMAYEVVWTRLLQIHLGTSIYAFSTMLGFYLIGISAGSVAGAKAAGKIRRPVLMLGYSQLAVAAFGLTGLFLLGYWYPLKWWHSLDFNLALMMVRAFILIFPMTFIFGFIFPLVCTVCVADDDKAGNGVGRVYSVNTAGCIIGSLVCGFILIRGIGTQGTVLFLSAVGAMAGLVLIFQEQPVFKRTFKIAAVVTVPLLIVLGGIFIPDPFLASVRKMQSLHFSGQEQFAKVFFHDEDVAATTTVLGIKNQPLQRHLLVNGIGMTYLTTDTKLMAHLPILLHPNPRKVCVICFGMGTTVRSVLSYPGIDCDSVELVSDVVKAFPYFHRDALSVMKNPRFHSYIDDGRNFLLMRPQAYDVVTIDPAPPLWSAGSVNLYTEEFFRLCRSRLTSEGIVSLWIPPWNLSEVGMIMKTFGTVFPNTYVFRGLEKSGIYLIGFKNSGKPSRERFKEYQHDAPVLRDLNEWNFSFIDTRSILSLLTLTPGQLKEFVKDFQVLTDDLPMTEFPLWRGAADERYKTSFNGLYLDNWRKQNFPAQAD